MALLNLLKTFNKGTDSCVSVPEIKVKDDDGNIRSLHMDGLSGVADDYSVRNLDKMGMQPSEVDPTSFRSADMDSSDSIIAAAQAVRRSRKTINE